MPVWNGSAWVYQKVVNAQVDAAAAIAYSKLNLAGSILTTDLSLPYATYTPTWTATGTAPAIGNATVVARYAQAGKIVHCYGLVIFGTTSTFGTGNYRFALPVTGAATALTAPYLSTGFALDSSASAQGYVTAQAVSTTTFQFVFSATYLGTNTAVGQTTPWTWATSDQLSWNFTYEAA